MGILIRIHLTGNGNDGINWGMLYFGFSSSTEYKCKHKRPWKRYFFK